jgi:triosephosphate isomerase (TIM)
MSRRPLIAGNWKMNKTPQETEEFLKQFLASVRMESDCDVLILPPFTSLDRAGALLSGSEVMLGAQDLHPAQSGAFTGSISAGMLVACGCTHVLAGHSERRHVFGDTDDDVNEKLRAALDHGLRPILCVGETLDQRTAGTTNDVLDRQLKGGLEGVSGDTLERVAIAYEPVWAIGTGETASPEQAERAIAFIRSWIASRDGHDAASAIRILYGGSVKPSNARALQMQPDIDGALIGGASLDPDSLLDILKEARSAQGTPPSC